MDGGSCYNSGMGSIPGPGNFHMPQAGPEKKINEDKASLERKERKTLVITIL